MSALGRDLDVRVSTFPTIHGENVVLRLLDRAARPHRPERAGAPARAPRDAPPDDRAAERDRARDRARPGAGKTTTLYACLHRINSVERNIVTLEDPVEIPSRLASARPRWIPTSGLTFARGLRALLRQDPDVIMVGEIRDVGDRGDRGALGADRPPGVRTLHTNDAAGAIPRLLDMGIEPFLLSSAMAGVVAQRLVRRVCERCQKPAEPPPALLEEIRVLPGRHGSCAARAASRAGRPATAGARGSSRCIEVNDAIRERIVARASSEDLGPRRARAPGCRPCGTTRSGRRSGASRRSRRCCASTAGDACSRAGSGRGSRWPLFAYRAVEAAGAARTGYPRGARSGPRDRPGARHGAHAGADRGRASGRGAWAAGCRFSLPQRRASPTRAHPLHAPARDHARGRAPAPLVSRDAPRAGDRSRPPGGDRRGPLRRRAGEHPHRGDGPPGRTAFLRSTWG